RGVFERFLMSDLRAGRVEVCHVRALVVARDLERAPRPCGRLLEDQADLLTIEVLLLRPRAFGAFEIARKLEDVAELLWRVVLNGQQRSVAQIECHVSTPNDFVKLWLSRRDWPESAQS